MFIDAMCYSLSGPPCVVATPDKPFWRGLFNCTVKAELERKIQPESKLLHVRATAIEFGVCTYYFWFNARKEYTFLFLKR